MTPLQLLESGLTSADNVECYFCQSKEQTLVTIASDVQCGECGVWLKDVLDDVKHIDDNDIADVVGAIDNYQGEYMSDIPNCVSYQYNDSFCSRLFSFLAALSQSYQYNITSQ